MPEVKNYFQALNLATGYQKTGNRFPIPSLLHSVISFLQPHARRLWKSAEAKKRGIAKTDAAAANYGMEIVRLATGWFLIDLASGSLNGPFSVFREAFKIACKSAGWK